MTTAAATASPDLKAFFGFTRHPFPPVCPPDPLFTTPAIRDALDSVKSAIQHRLHALVTAPPGSGKTSFARLLNAELNPRDYRYTLLMGQSLSATEFLNQINDALNFDTGWRRGQAIKALTTGLRNLQNSQGPLPVLLIDEAQLVPFVAMELVRTVAEDAPRPLMSMVLLGDQTLHTRLYRPSAAALLGRMAARIQLEPYSEDETAAFVAHAFEVAGMENLLSPTAIAPLHAASSGQPRKIAERLRLAMRIAQRQRSRMLTDSILQEALDATQR